MGQLAASKAIGEPQCIQYLFCSSANSIFPSPLNWSLDAVITAVPLTCPEVIIAVAANDFEGIVTGLVIVPSVVVNSTFLSSEKET